MAKPLGPLEMTKTIVQNEGLMAFYKGTTSPLIGISFIVSIQFAVNEVMKRMFVDMNTKAKKENVYYLSNSQYFFSGVMGGITSGLVANPVEHIRIRLQVQTGAEKNGYTGCMDATKKIMAGHGAKGLF